MSMWRLALAAVVFGWPGLSLRHHAVTAVTATNCTTETAVVRKEYGSLSTRERLQFVSAIQCVMNKPSLLHDTIPATTNKFDDFAAVHFNMTTSIHLNGIFLAWHRHFVWLMERELHECGFPDNLGMPYWNWTLWPELEKSPILYVRRGW